MKNIALNYRGVKNHNLRLSILNMKKIIFLLLTLIFIKANAQTADEVIQKYATAMGGLENFKKVKTLKMTGTVTAQGMDLPLTIQVINERAVRTDVEVMGQSVISAYKDGKGWKINPFAGAPTATDVTGTELADVKNQCYLASQLMNYKNRGDKVELQGQETLEGVKTYKILLTDSANTATTFYVDAATYLPVRIMAKREMMGREMDLATTFSDFKDFNGLKFSTSRVQKNGDQVLQEIHIDKIELDVPIDEKIFDKQ